MLHSSLLCTLLALGLLSPRAQEEEATEAWYFGSSFDQIADLDGDGSADLIVVSDRAPHKWASGRRLNPWSVLAVSGSSGEVIWSVQSSSEPSRYERKFVKAWADWDRDGVSDVLLWKGIYPRQTGEAWKANVLSGKTGQTLAAFPDLPFVDLGEEAIAAPPRRSEEDATPTSGFILERRARKASSLESLPYVPEKGKEWDTLGIWSLEPGGVELLYESMVPGGKFFTSRPVWVAGRSAGEVWGVATLIDSRIDGTSVLRLIQSREGEDEEIEWHWLGPSGVRFPTHARLSAVEIGDVNGDAVSDLAVGATGHVNPDIESKVVIVSGETGRRLYEIRDHGEGIESFHCGGLRDWGCGFACSVASLGDLDDDGCSEILVDSHQTALSQGSVILFNPRKRKSRGVIHAWGDDWLGDMSNRFGMQIVAGLDFDADGTPDFVAREDWYNHSGDDGPGLFLFSGATLELIRRFPTGK